MDAGLELRRWLRKVRGVKKKKKKKNIERTIYIFVRAVISLVWCPQEKKKKTQIIFIAKAIMGFVLAEYVSQ